MKKLIVSILIFVSVTFANAQSELILHYFDDVFQTSYLNAAINPAHKVSIGLPVISSLQMQVIHNGFVFSNVINGNTISPQKILDNASKQNMLHLNADLDIFHLRIRVNNAAYWIGIRQKHNLSFFYPKELFELIVKGNAHFVGQHMDFSAFGINSNIYREYTLGMSRAVDDWYFGGRISFLNGLSSVYLKPDFLEMHVLDEMYAHAFNTNAAIYSSGIPFDQDIDGPWVTDYLTRIRNPGVAIALGSNYRIDERWNLVFSASDLGFINWSDNTRNYQLNGMTEFKGFDVISDLINGEDVDFEDTFDNMLDDLNGEEFEKAYTTWLAPRFSVAANYQISHKTTLRAGVFATHNRNFYPAVSVGATHQFGKVLTIALNAAANQKSFANLGMGFVLNPGPFQLFFMTDNFYAPLFSPASFTNFNIRFGLNFAVKYDRVLVEPLEI